MKNWTKILRLQRRRGFSLIEVLIGLVILMLALASAAALAYSNATLLAKNQFAVHAENLAEQKMEDLRNQSVGNVVDGADATPLNSFGQPDNDGSFTRSWAVVDPDFGDYGGTLKQVEVTVTWNQGGQQQIYVLAGVLGDAG